LKWSKFKKERANVIDLYLVKKKNGKMMKEIIVKCEVRKVLYAMLTNINFFLKKRETFLRVNKIITRMCNRIRFKLSRKGRDIETIHLDKTRRRITVGSLMIKEAMESRARAILKTVILGTVGKSIFEDKMIKTWDSIHYMSRKLVNMPLFFEAKCSVIITYWDKFI